MRSDFSLQNWCVARAAWACRKTGGMGCFLDDLRYQQQPVNDCSPGRGGMAQDCGPRGGTFYGENGSLQRSQGWTTAGTSMPERDGKDQRQDSPTQA